MTPEEKSRIDELNKSLYSRNAPEVRQKRRLKFAPTEAQEVPTDWKHPEEGQTGAEQNNEDKKMSFVTKLFIGSLIFFICALSIGAYFILRGKNIISADNIDIRINGPVTVSGGDPVTFDIEVLNKNNVTLETVDLVVDFPSGTVDPVERSKELREFRQLMDDIRPGDTGKKTIGAVLYGEENIKKEIKVDVSYRVAGSNAVFRKQKTFEVLISSSPLSLSVNSFKEVTSGQEFGVEVTLVSNSSEIIRNLILRAEFPFGFTLTSADVKAEGNRANWKIGDLPPNGKKIIRLKGNLEGQDGESRVFRFTAGAESGQRPGTIATEYIAASREIAIRKPFISTSIAFDNDTGSNDYIGSFGVPVRTTLSWFNNLSSAITDAEIRVKLSGNAYDKIAVSPGAGYYRSTDSEITWNKQTTSNLSSIGAGDNGSIDFSFTPHNFSTPSRPVTNPSVTLEVSVLGKRFSESNVPETEISSTKRTIKISSDLSIGAQVTRGNSPFENTGPIPPKADQQTTYTVTMTVDNTVNTVSGAQVKAFLPVYVKWLGKVSPSGEDVVYNANGEVIWRVGNVDTFTKNSGRRRQVSFQIAVVPSVSQIGQIPPIVENIQINGIDDFTGANLTSSHSTLSTRYEDGFQEGMDVVAQ